MDKKTLTELGYGVSCLYEKVLEYVPVRKRPGPQDDDLRLETTHLFLNANKVRHTEIEARKIAVEARNWSNGKKVSG